MSAKISVIIPIFNVEDYLRKCIQSVRNQTYRNLEILLVNDGSTDHSGLICEEYALLDNRIKVIHKENGGRSDARNVGIEAASGEFLGFVDGDDWIDEDMYEVLYRLITEYKADMSICRIREVFGGKVRDGFSEDLVVCNGTEALIYMVTQKNNYRFEHSITNKLVRKELIENFRFPVGKLMEDLYFTPSLIYASQKCVYTNLSKYNYLTNRDTSIMNSKVTEKKIFDELNGYKELEFLCSTNNIQGCLTNIREVFIGRVLNFHYEVKHSSLENKEKLLITLEGLFRSNLNYSLKSSMNSERKVQIRLFEISPDLYDRVHGIALKTVALKKKFQPKKLVI